jgi:hypothetical protein
LIFTYVFLIWIIVQISLNFNAISRFSVETPEETLYIGILAPK